MRRVFLALLITVHCALLATLLTACGFDPLYARHGVGGPVAAIDGFNDIEIGNIPDRSGQYLRNAMMDRFYTKGRPLNARWALEISPIRETRYNLGITKSADATRAQLRLETTITLAEKATHKTVLTRSATAMISYNILQSQFTTNVSEKKARESGLDDLAQQVERHLALFFIHPEKMEAEPAQ